MVDAGSNVCITSDLGSLLDVVDIDPISISVAIDGSSSSFDDCITKRGVLPLSLSDGTTYFQPCYYCANLVETIISPAAILATSNVFYSWTQEGFRNPTIPGSLRFSSHDGLTSMHFPLRYQDGLYYCDTDVYTVDRDPVRPTCARTNALPTDTLPHPHRPAPKFVPTTRARQVESEVWALCFGSTGEGQLDALPKHVDGTPPVFEYHPFRHIDFKEQAYIRKQPAQKTAERLPECSSEFYMDFGFMRASHDDYQRPNKHTNQIVQSYDGYSSYLLVVDGTSRRVWVFLTESKTPPIAILRAFLTKFGLVKGVLRTNQGSKLTRSVEFRKTMMNDFAYTEEPTGANSPSQNGGAEIYNGTLAVKVRTLLYGSGLPAKFWSTALLHSVYLHNRLVHSSVGMTPYEAWYGRRPGVTFLKTFSSRVCVRQSGS